MKLNPIQFACGFLILTLLSPTFALAVSEKQVTTTDVGTYDVTLKTNPDTPKLGEKTHLFIEVISKKIRDTQIHVDYQILILKDNEEILSTGAQHTHTGTTSVSHTFDTAGEYVVIVLIDGIVFAPIPLEAAAFSLPVGQTVDEPPTPQVTKESEMKETSSKTFIPEWIKDVAAFWIDDQIDDSGFVQVIEWLVQNDVIKIPYAEPPEEEAAADIPNWIKTNAEFWVNGDVSDDEFATALEWLINNGIIKIKDQSERIVPAFEIEGNLFPTYQFTFTPNSPDCPDFHLHATSGYTVDAVLVSFTDHDPGGCGLGIAKEIPTQDVSMTEGQILEWEKVSGVKIPEE